MTEEDLDGQEGYTRKKKKSITWHALFLQFLSVTFGVLLAFQLSLWQEGNKEKKAFDRLLERVAIEARQNLAACEKHITELEAEVNTSLATINAISEGQLSDDGLAEQLAKHLNLTTSTYAISNLQSALRYDNSRYRQDLIPLLNELLKLEDETNQIGQVRLENFTNTILPAIGDKLDFETDLPITRPLNINTKMKNQIIVSFGLCNNSIEAETSFKNTLVRFDSIAVARGWIGE